MQLKRGFTVHGYGDVATCSSIIEINNYCQLCSIMYLVYCIQNTIKIYI